MAARFTIDEVANTLASSGAAWSARPGMVISATFPRRDQRDGLLARFDGATIAAAGTAVTLDRSRTWADEHGWGMTLWPAP